MASLVIVAALVLLGIGVLALAWLPGRGGEKEGAEIANGVSLTPFSPAESAARRMAALSPREDTSGPQSVAVVPTEASEELTHGTDTEHSMRDEDLLSDLFSVPSTQSQEAPATLECEPPTQETRGLGPDEPVLDEVDPVSAEDSVASAAGSAEVEAGRGTPIEADLSWEAAALRAAEEDEEPQLGDLSEIFAELLPENVSVAPLNPSAPPARAESTAPKGELRHRRRRGDKNVALAKFPYDPEVWDDPLSPRRRRRLQKRAEIEQKRAAAASEKAYKRIERAKAEREALADQVVKLSGAQEPAPALEEQKFQDVWSRAANTEAPSHDAIEQPKARRDRRSQKKSVAARRKAAKADAKLERLLAKHSASAVEETVAEAVVLEEVVEIGRGVDASISVQADDISTSGELSTDTTPQKDELRIEVLDELPASDDVLVGGENISERERKRAERKAEKESRKLEKLAKKQQRRDEKAPRSKALSGSAESFELEGTPGLGDEASAGVWDEAALETHAEQGPRGSWEQGLGDDAGSEEPLSASAWEAAIGTEDGLQAAAVSSWEAAARGVTDFVDPTGGARHTDVQELLDLGHAIEDTAVAGEGKGREAINVEDDVEDVESGFDAIIEVGGSDRKRRSFLKRKRNDDDDDDGVSIGEWISDGATVVTVTSDFVDHHSYDLPEPIPDRVQVAFSNED